MEAREFSTATNYVTGDLVLYGGKLYRFISNHSAGAWNGNDVAAVDDNIQQQVSRIMAAYENAQKAVAYAGTVVFAPSAISGTRYKYILTNAPDPRN